MLHDKATTAAITEHKQWLVEQEAKTANNQQVLAELQEIRRHFALTGNSAAVLALTLAIDLRLGLDEVMIRAGIADLKSLLPKHQQCEAAVGPDAYRCAHGAIYGERFCTEHLKEWD
jgi:hypothetical protein